MLFQSKYEGLIYENVNSAALDAFAEIMKVMNHTEMWDAKLTWYSLSATHQV